MRSMGVRYVVWVALSLVLGCAGVISAARAGAPILIPYSFVLPSGWVLAVAVSLLLAWALRLIPGTRGTWLGVLAGAAVIAFIAADPVLVLVVAGYECGIENGLGGHCKLL